MTRQARTVLVTGGALAALAWLLKGKAPIATVTVSETFDFSPYGGPASYPQAISNVATAIAKQEGFYVPGSIPQRANNPGDLKVPGAPTLPGTSITMFASADLGWAALKRQLWLIVSGGSAYYSLDMTIADMARTWTATQQTEWANNVSRALGVSPSTPLWTVLL